MKWLPIEGSRSGYLRRSPRQSRKRHEFRNGGAQFRPESGTNTAAAAAAAPAAAAAVAVEAVAIADVVGSRSGLVVVSQRRFVVGLRRQIDDVRQPTRPIGFRHRLRRRFFTRDRRRPGAAGRLNVGPTRTIVVRVELSRRGVGDADGGRRATAAGTAVRRRRRRRRRCRRRFRSFFEAP